MRRLFKKHKKRILQDGSVATELDECVTLTVYTRCPGKYKLIDMETGEEYIGQDPGHNKHHWKKNEQ